MTLTIIKPPEAVENLKVLLFAGSGVGKSVGAGTAPGPILWLNAEGQDALRFARHVHGNDKILEVEVVNKETLVDAYLYAKDPANSIATMVVDSVGEVYKLLLADRASKNPARVQLKGKPSLSDHGDAQEDLLEIVRKLRDLPINVVFICIQQDVDVTDADGETITEFIPFVGPSKPKCSRQIMGMVQVVGYVARQEPSEEDEGPKWVAQVVPAKGRPCKDRTVHGLGSIAPLDIEAWVAAEVAATTPKKRSAA